MTVGLGERPSRVGCRGNRRRRGPPSAATLAGLGSAMFTAAWRWSPCPWRSTCAGAVVARGWSWPMPRRRRRVWRRQRARSGSCSRFFRGGPVPAPARLRRSVATWRPISPFRLVCGYSIVVGPARSRRLGRPSPCLCAPWFNPLFGAARLFERGPPPRRPGCCCLHVRFVARGRRRLRCGERAAGAVHGAGPGACLVLNPLTLPRRPPRPDLAVVISQTTMVAVHLTTIPSTRQRPRPGLPFGPPSSPSTSSACMAWPWSSPPPPIASGGSGSSRLRRGPRPWNQGLGPRRLPPAARLHWAVPARPGVELPPIRPQLHPRPRRNSPVKMRAGW